MKKILVSFLILTTVAFLPMPVSAAVCTDVGTPQNFSEIICLFVDLISTAIPVVAAIAVLVFIWGLAKFILKAGSESDREEGKQIMVWGIVALFVLVSISGIIVFLSGEFFGYSPVVLPTLPE